MNSPRVTLRLPRDVLRDVETLVESGEYKNRSEAIREGVTRLDGVREGPERLATDGGRTDGGEGPERASCPECGMLNVKPVLWDQTTPGMKCTNCGWYA